MTEDANTVLARKVRRRALARDPLIALLVILFASTMLFIGLWAYALFQIQREAHLTSLTLDAEQKERAKKDEEIRKELDLIYSTLYAPLETPTQQRQPSTVELWQRNRDAELRNRINALERRMFKLEQ